jgi:hypothetical protein
MTAITSAFGRLILEIDSLIYEPVVERERISPNGWHTIDVGVDGKLGKIVYKINCGKPVTLLTHVLDTNRRDFLSLDARINAWIDDQGTLCVSWKDDVELMIDIDQMKAIEIVKLSTSDPTFAEVKTSLTYNDKTIIVQHNEAAGTLLIETLEGLAAILSGQCAIRFELNGFLIKRRKTRWHIEIATAASRTST